MNNVDIYDVAVVGRESVARLVPTRLSCNPQHGKPFMEARMHSASVQNGHTTTPIILDKLTVCIPRRDT